MPSWWLVVRFIDRFYKLKLYKNGHLLSKWVLLPTIRLSALWCERWWWSCLLAAMPRISGYDTTKQLIMLFFFCVCLCVSALSFVIFITLLTTQLFHDWLCIKNVFMPLKMLTVVLLQSIALLCWAPQQLSTTRKSGRTNKTKIEEQDGKSPYKQFASCLPSSSIKPETFTYSSQYHHRRHKHTHKHRKKPTLCTITNSHMTECVYYPVIHAVKHIKRDVKQSALLCWKI